MSFVFNCIKSLQCRPAVCRYCLFVQITVDVEIRQLRVSGVQRMARVAPFSRRARLHVTRTFVAYRGHDVAQTGLQVWAQAYVVAERQQYGRLADVLQRLLDLPQVFLEQCVVQLAVKPCRVGVRCG